VNSARQSISEHCGQVIVVGDQDGVSFSTVFSCTRQGHGIRSVRVSVLTTPNDHPPIFSSCNGFPRTHGDV
jgi:hypothetical protein